MEEHVIKSYLLLRKELDLIHARSWKRSEKNVDQYVINPLFEDSYPKFRAERLRNDNDGSEKAYYENLKYQIDQIEKQLIELEKGEDGNVRRKFLAVYDSINKYKSIISSKIVKDKNQKRISSRRNPRTYVWSADKRLKDDFRKMIEKTFTIKTNPNNFEAVFFDGVEINDDLVPIKWKSNNATELNYFIGRLVKNGFLKPETKFTSKQKHGCFKGAEGQELTTNFANVHDDDLSQDGKDKVDMFIERLIGLATPYST